MTTATATAEPNAADQGPIVLSAGETRLGTDWFFTVVKEMHPNVMSFFHRPPLWKDPLRLPRGGPHSLTAACRTTITNPGLPATN